MAAGNDMDAAVAAGAQNHRVPMGRDALASLANKSAENHAKMLRARGGAQAGDPGLFPTATRGKTMVSGPNEPAGARYGIRVNTAAPTLPEAGPTTANGRVIPARGTPGQGFAGGAQDAAL